MIISNSTLFLFRRKCASMYVLRNNGYCWGRIMWDGGDPLDVSAAEDEDQYDREDGDATEYFIERAKQGHCEPAVGSSLISRYKFNQEEKPKMSSQLAVVEFMDTKRKRQPRYAALIQKTPVRRYTYTFPVEADILIGDTVVVPVGDYGHTRRAKVVAIDPLPYKSIIGKVVAI